MVFVRKRLAEQERKNLIANGFFSHKTDIKLMNKIGKLRLWTPLLAMLLLTFSCEKDIEYHLPEKDPQLVINGLLHYDSVARINVSQSMMMNKVYEEIPYLDENARVELYRGGKKIENLHYLDEGNFEGTHLLEVNQKYLVQVQADDFLPATAEVWMPEAVPVSDYEADTMPFFDGYETWEEFVVRLEFEDPANVENAYLIKVWRCFEDGEGLAYRDRCYLLVNEQLNSVMRLDDGRILLNDDFTDGKLTKVEFVPDAYFFNGYMEIRNPRLEVEFQSISPGFYKYLKSQQQQQNVGEDPFSEPVQVFSNVENGLGILASTHISLLTIPIELPY